MPGLFIFMEKRRAIIFIDGSNFYHNSKSLINKPSKIDFKSLSKFICDNFKLELKEIPLATSLGMLGDIEHKLNLPLTVLEHQIDMRNPTSPINLQFTYFKIIDCFKKNDFENIPQLVHDFTYFMKLGQKVMAAQEQIWDKTEIIVTNDEIYTDNLFNEVLFYLMFSATICMLPDNLHTSTFPEWRKIISDIPSKDVIDTLDRLEILAQTPTEPLLDIIKNDSVNKTL